MGTEFCQALQHFRGVKGKVAHGIQGYLVAGIVCNNQSKSARIALRSCSPMKLLQDCSIVVILVGPSAIEGIYRD